MNDPLFLIPDDRPKLGPGSLLTDEERKARKKTRNAAYREAHRARLIAAKRAAYKAKKDGAPDRRVYDVELAHTKALRVERNNRYRGRLRMKAINRQKNQNRLNFSTPGKRYGQKMG